MNVSSNDFPELRAAMRESAVGATAVSIAAALRVAWAEAFVTRAINNRIERLRRTPPEELTRSIGIVLATAALTAWMLSLRTPAYLSTSIPSWAFFFAAAASAVMAAWPEAFRNQWSRSSLRRVSRLFRRS